jgi:hypothetical protein
MSVLLQEWKEKIETWRNSGLSVAAWCRQNNEGYDRFIYWRKRLKAHPQKTGRFVELTFGQATLSIECNGTLIHLEQTLKNYQGLLHSDKYGAYEKLARCEVSSGVPAWPVCGVNLSRQKPEIPCRVGTSCAKSVICFS